MTRPPTPLWRRFLRFVVVVACLPPALLLGVNVFINLWLPGLINMQPERVKVTWAVAWMVVPGEVEVNGLFIRSQSPFDQVSISVDHATGTIALRDLFDKRFRAYDIVAQGASLRYRARKDAPAPPVVVPVVSPDAPRLPDSLVADAPPTPPAAPPEPGPDRTPSIDGLLNPPVPNPDTIYPPPPGYWTIVIADTVITDVREIWLEDYHFVGEAQVRAREFTLQPTMFVALDDAQVTLVDGQVLLGEDAALLGIKGKIGVSLDGLSPKDNPGRSIFGFLTVDADIAATVKNLAFLDFYLRAAPWLALSGGKGDLAVTIAMKRGEFLPGSVLSAGVKDISAQFYSYSIVGDGRVRMSVDTVDALPESTLQVNFDDFVIEHAGDSAPHATGKGLSVVARTADVALDDPFTALRIEIDLPSSTLPDAAVYNTYLPRGIGLQLRDGQGTVSGHLAVTTPENIVRGKVNLAASGIRMTLDDLTLRGDVAIDVDVPSGRLDAGRYDVSGSALRLRNVRVSGRAGDKTPSEGSAGWWATLRVPRGTAASGGGGRFDATLALQMRDSVPLVTVFSEKEPLPKWVRGLLDIDGLGGTARVELGGSGFHIPRLELSGAHRFLAKLALERRGRSTRGKLYVRYGILQAGIRLDDDARKVIIFTPKKWFAKEKLGT